MRDEIRIIFSPWTALPSELVGGPLGAMLHVQRDFARAVAEAAVAAQFGFARAVAEAALDAQRAVARHLLAGAFAGR
jgi:hypothetical protein